MVRSSVTMQMLQNSEGGLADPMPMWEMVTRRCGNQLYIFITKRGTEKLEGFHKHLKEVSGLFVECSSSLKMHPSY